MKAKTGQIFHNGSIRYLLVEVRLDQEVDLGRGPVLMQEWGMTEGPGRYAMVISGHRDLGRLWRMLPFDHERAAFAGQEYYPTWKVVEDVGFLETVHHNPGGPFPVKEPWPTGQARIPGHR